MSFEGSMLMKLKLPRYDWQDARRITQSTWKHLHALLKNYSIWNSMKFSLVGGSKLQKKIHEQRNEDSCSFEMLMIRNVSKPINLFALLVYTVQIKSWWLHVIAIRGNCFKAFWAVSLMLLEICLISSCVTTWNSKFEISYVNLSYLSAVFLEEKFLMDMWSGSGNLSIYNFSIVNCDSRWR